MKTHTEHIYKFTNYVKYATKNSILESLTGYRKQKVIDLLRNKTFNQMRIIGN